MTYSIISYLPYCSYEIVTFIIFFYKTRTRFGFWAAKKKFKKMNKNPVKFSLKYATMFRHKVVHSEGARHLLRQVLRGQVRHQVHQVRQGQPNHVNSHSVWPLSHKHNLSYIEGSNQHVNKSPLLFPRIISSFKYTRPFEILNTNAERLKNASLSKLDRP